MWGAQQGWNQWALQPAMFNDVPHEQIDWAALAKQWIQMQQTQSHSDPSAPAVVPPIPPTAASVQPNIPPPPGHGPILSEEFSESSVSAPLLKTPIVPGTMPEPFQPERSFDTEPAIFLPKQVNNSYWNKPQWEPSATNDMDERHWPGPSIEPTPSIIGGKETYDYGHMHDNPPLTMQSIDYNHMSDFSYNQVYPSENQYDQYWSQVNAAPPVTPIFLKKEHTSTPSTSLPIEEDTSQIDAAKRKQLPAWIREGLEKMEQERLKKIEKERAEKEKAAKLAQSKLKSSLKEDTSLIPVKSKFESDSDVEDEEADSDTRTTNDPVVAKRSPSPVEDLRTEEEKRQEFILNVRRILTEVLLTVTDAEMRAIAEEVIKKETLKARQLASTASLTSVASGLRILANYGTESEASEAEEDKEESDSEEELHRRIKEKKRLFSLKQKKIAELEQKELEEQEALKAQNENTKPVYNESPEPEIDDQVSMKEEDASIPFLAPVAEMTEQASDEIPPMSDTNLDAPTEVTEKCNKDPNHSIKKFANSPDSSSNSSENESESSEKQTKKSEKNEHDKKVSDRYKRNKDKSPPRKHRRSQSSGSDSSSRHHKSRSYDKSSKKSSCYKKKKKYKRSDSSSSSSRESSTRRYSSKSETSHNHRREHRSHSFDDRDRKRKRSVSPKNYRSSTGSHRSRDSYSYRHEKDKYDKRNKYYEYKKSPSPHIRRSSKLPKKYRSSRSPSSEIESSGKKFKKSRNH